MTPAVAYGFVEGGLCSFETKKRHQLFAYALNVLRANNPYRDPASKVIKCELSLMLLGVYLQFSASMPTRWTLVAYFPVSVPKTSVVRLAEVVLATAPVSEAADLTAPLAALRLCADRRGWPSRLMPDDPVNIVIAREDKLAYKVFSSKSSRHPNSALFAPVFCASVVKSPYNSPDGDLSVLQYSFVEGTPQLATVQHAVSLLKDLLRLWKRGFVHGDVRGANIVCCPDGAAYLIDYDLAGRDGVGTYPEGYVSDSLPDVSRHADAQAGLVMKPEHDLFAMHSIFARYHCDEEANATWTTCLAEMLQRQRSPKQRAESVCSQLRRFLETPLLLNADCTVGAKLQVFVGPPQKKYFLNLHTLALLPQVVLPRH